MKYQNLDAANRIAGKIEKIDSILNSLSEEREPAIIKIGNTHLYKTAFLDIEGAGARFEAYRMQEIEVLRAERDQLMSELETL